MAGEGSRFSKNGYKTPKPLLDIEGLPMIIQAVECLPKTSHKIFIGQDSHYKKYNIDDKIKQFYPEAKTMAIDYITEGQACTTDLAFQNFNIPLENPLLVSACDNGVYYDVNEYIKISRGSRSRYYYLVIFK